MKPSLSIGLMEEYQTIDPETRDLRSHIGLEMIQKGKAVLTERVKPEMHQSVIEAGTRVCRNIQEAKAEIHMIRPGQIEPGSPAWPAPGGRRFPPVRQDWSTQEIYPDQRYHTIVEDMQMVARADLIFGLHVHIGVEDPETAIHIMNAARYFLPHILALSTNSPFWRGMDSGLKSYRCKVFNSFPAPTFRITFQATANTRASSTCSSKPIASIMPRRSGGISALILISARWSSASATFPCAPRRPLPWPLYIQATVAKLYKLHSMNQGFRLYRRALIMENKWRALRYGIDGKLIDFGKRVEVPLRDLMEEYLEIIDDVVDELGSRAEINYIREILKNGTGADRQLRVWNETHDMTKVVDFIVAETEAGVERAAERQQAAT